MFKIYSTGGISIYFFYITAISVNNTPVFHMSRNSSSGMFCKFPLYKIKKR